MTFLTTVSMLFLAALIFGLFARSIGFFDRIINK
jgi:hypothetical protein